MRNAQAQVAAAQADIEAKRAALQSQLLDQRSSQAQAQADYASAKVKEQADAKAMTQQLIPRVQFEQEQIALIQLKNRVDIETQRVASFGSNRRAQLDAVRAALASSSKATCSCASARPMRSTSPPASPACCRRWPCRKAPSVAAGANLARVARPDVLIARLQVPEVQAKDVAVGMPVSVDTHNGLVDGRVDRIDPAVTAGSVQIDVRLTGTLPPGSRPDLSVDGRIRIATLNNVLSVGRPALAKADGDISLFRLNGAGVATRVPVRIGAASVDRVQIIRGLKVGDQVILSDTSQWDAYDRIKVQ